MSAEDDAEIDRFLEIVTQREPSVTDVERQTIERCIAAVFGLPTADVEDDVLDYLYEVVVPALRALLPPEVDR